MKSTALVFLAALLAGCATHRDDARLQGTWHSDRDASVAAAFQRDPRWTNAPPEKIQRFRDMFGHLTVTYSNQVGTIIYEGATNSFHYRVVEHGSNYVVMRDDTPLDKGHDIHIRFVDGDTGYWTKWAGFGIEEKFDRVTTPPNTALEPTPTAP